MDKSSSEDPLPLTVLPLTVMMGSCPTISTFPMTATAQSSASKHEADLQLLSVTDPSELLDLSTSPQKEPPHLRSKTVPALHAQPTRREEKYTETTKTLFVPEQATCLSISDRTWILILFIIVLLVPTRNATNEKKFVPLRQNPSSTNANTLPFFQCLPLIIVPLVGVFIEKHGRHRWRWRIYVDTRTFTNIEC
jgi:hypothetical protein